MAEEDKKPATKIIKKLIEDEMKSSYIDYAMSVIVGRALPDVRDGLKPVHRRILYAMHDMGMFFNKPFKKSARIVGECLGKYHPHGDTAVYDSLVRMAQDFSLRYPLIKGQGNFGSIDGDRQAAMRYTEAKLSKISGEMLQDIDKETVKFVPNFDNSLKEPSILPSKIPNLLINGSSGIAVGMATNIPPHNLIEICDGVIRTIDNPEIELNELFETIKGPDFPTSGIITGKQGIANAYKTGRGKIKVRSKHHIETKKEREAIIITEIPYMVNKSMMIEQIADQVRNKVITGISGLRDESDREGIRVVIELKRDANSEVVVNQLFKHTKAQTTFGINTLALVNNEPKILNLLDMLKHFIKHRQSIVRKRTEFDLRKAEAKAHILEGLIKALDNLDKTISLIKKSKSAVEAKEALIAEFDLSEKQAAAILDMKLQKLTNLEQNKLRDDHKETLDIIKKLKEILASEQKILNIIKEELEDIKKTYGDGRKTEIIEAQDDIEMEDMIKPEDMVITVTHKGYTKRLPIDTYRQQKRGGKGIIAQSTKDEDFVEHLFIANTHSYILFFTDTGKVHWLKVYMIPEASRTAHGKPVVNLIDTTPGEKVTAMIPVREFDDKHFLIMATKKGIVKKTNLIQYSRPRAGGIKGIILDEGDSLINVKLTNGNEKVLLASRNGLAVKFNEKDARPIGRTSRGVRGMTLRKGDELIGMVMADNDRALLTITENGYGKRTEISEYRLINRGGVGVINIQCSERNGKVVAVKSVTSQDDLMFISHDGIIIRTSTKDISVIGRNTQGVRLMRLTKEDKVVAAAKIVNGD